MKTIKGYAFKVYTKGYDEFEVFFYETLEEAFKEYELCPCLKKIGLYYAEYSWNTHGWPNVSYRFFGLVDCQTMWALEEKFKATV